MEKQHGPLVLDENYRPEVIAKESEIVEREDYISSQERIAGPGILGVSEANDGVPSANPEAGRAVHPRGPPTSGQSILGPNISSDSGSINDIVFDTPSWSPRASPDAGSTTPADTEAGAVYPRGLLTSTPRIDGVSAGRSPTRTISEDPEAGVVHPRGLPTSPVVDLMEILRRIESTEIVPHAIIDAVVGPPSSSPTGRDGIFPLSVASGPIAAGHGPSSTNGIPAAMSPTKSPGANGTLPVLGVNRPIWSSLEARQGPPRTDETSAALSPTRRTPEDPEAGEVPARDVYFLMKAINIFIGFLAIFMELVSVLVPSNEPVELAVLVLNLISSVTMLITFMAVAIHKGVEFQFPYLIKQNGERYGSKLDYVEIFGATVQAVFDIICRCLKLSLRSINLVILVLSVGLFSLNGQKISRKYS